MIHRRRFLNLVAAAAGAVTFSALPAAAQSLDDLRASGIVGEAHDGFAVVRDANASAQARAMVADVNAQRRSIYAKRASEQGVRADQVGKVYAQQIISNAPAGTWFRDENGNWRR